MALQIWLPLNNSVNNQGLANVVISTIGTITYENGKIGKAFKVGTGTQVTNGISINSNLVEELGNEYSCAVWVKPTGNHVHYEGAIISSGDWNKKRWAFGLKQDNSAVDMFGPGYNRYLTCSIPVNEWTHLVSTFKDNIGTLYKNGEYIGTYTFNQSIDTVGGLESDATNTTIGRETYAGGYFGFNGSLNDIRIYDHCLSQKEVKEIAKGLVLHYPLNDQYNASNLVYNGFGEHGSDGWDGATVSTTDLPTNESSIKASFTGGISRNYVLINPNNTFSISAYLKTSGATSGTTYPSIYPYDIDKKFIYYFNCAAGFNNTWKTTLSQPLNTGDTVIHATDISNWSTANNNYYYHVSIFGYRDSTGHLYPDMEYTQDSPVFGTYSDKSNLNKTNNTITLKAPYTGAPRPAGTVICQATEGGTNFYPFGGVQISTIADWTQRTSTISFGNEPRLRNARYIKWHNYTGAKYAGIKITDITWGSNVVYDTSGFGNNGEIYTADSTGYFQCVTGSPRYSVATNIHSGTSTVNQKAGTAYIRGNLALTTPNQLTIAFWCYARPEGYSDATVQGQFCTTNNTGDSVGSDYLGSAMNHRGGAVDVNDSSASIHLRLSINFTWNTQCHYAFTYDGQNAKSYRNGILQNTVSFSSATDLASFTSVILGFSKAGGVWRKNNNDYSDLRVFATALTADDVLELYHTPISLSNNGALLTQGEFVES